MIWLTNVYVASGLRCAWAEIFIATDAKYFEIKFCTKTNRWPKIVFTETAFGSFLIQFQINFKKILKCKLLLSITFLDFFAVLELKFNEIFYLGNPPVRNLISFSSRKSIIIEKSGSTAARQCGLAPPKCSKFNTFVLMKNHNANIYNWIIMQNVFVFIFVWF